MWIEEINQDTQDWLEEMTDSHFLKWLEMGRLIVTDREQFIMCLEKTREELEEIEDYEKCKLLQEYRRINDYIQI